jgi:hypothetical protein
MPQIDVFVLDMADLSKAFILKQNVLHTQIGTSGLGQESHTLTIIRDGSTPGDSTTCMLETTHARGSARAARALRARHALRPIAKGVCNPWSSMSVLVDLTIRDVSEREARTALSQQQKTPTGREGLKTHSVICRRN